MAETENGANTPAAENNNTEVAAPANAEVAMPQDLSEEGFKSYIEGIKDGTEPPQKSKEEPKPEQNKEHEAFKVFDTEEDFQGFMQKTIGERLKSSREENSRYEDLGRKAQILFGGNTPQEGLLNMLEHSTAQRAEQEGKAPEVTESEIQDRMDAEAFRRIREEESEKENVIANIQKGWLEDSENLKRAVPDFDFDKAMENEKFRELVLSGLTPSGAYIQIMNAEKIPEPKRSIKEVGSFKTGGNTQGAIQNPAAMSDDEFKRYIERIKG